MPPGEALVRRDTYDLGAVSPTGIYAPLLSEAHGRLERRALAVTRFDEIAADPAKFLTNSTNLADRLAVYIANNFSIIAQLIAQGRGKPRMLMDALVYTIAATPEFKGISSKIIGDILNGLIEDPGPRQDDEHAEATMRSLFSGLPARILKRRRRDVLAIVDGPETHLDPNPPKAVDITTLLRTLDPYGVLRNALVVELLRMGFRAAAQEQVHGLTVTPCHIRWLVDRLAVYLTAEKQEALKAVIAQYQLAPEREVGVLTKLGASATLGLIALLWAISQLKDGGSFSPAPTFIMLIGALIGRGQAGHLGKIRVERWVPRLMDRRQLRAAHTDQEPDYSRVAELAHALLVDQQLQAAQVRVHDPRLPEGEHERVLREAMALVAERIGDVIGPAKEEVVEVLTIARDVRGQQELSVADHVLGALEDHHD